MLESIGDAPSDESRLRCAPRARLDDAGPSGRRTQRPIAPQADAAHRKDNRVHLFSSKRSLLELSHVLESFVLDVPSYPVTQPRLVIGLFQRRGYFDREADRYQQMAEMGVECIVAFAGETSDVPKGVTSIELDPGEQLADLWSVVVIDDRLGVALSAVDGGVLSDAENTLEAARMFTGWWSFDRREAVNQARWIVESLGERLPTAARRWVLALVEQPTIDLEALDQLRDVSEMLMVAIERETRRSTRLSRALLRSQTLADTDHLTGLRNRYFLERYLNNLGSDSTARMAALLLDVDGLGQINDTFGHTAGDAALATIADCLRASSRSGDIVCRLGSDEFLMLLPGMDENDALLAAQRLVATVAAAKPPEPWSHLALSLSIGVAMGNPAQLPIESLDEALYEVKRTGRGAARITRSGMDPRRST